jgi:hypothetical protein
MRTTIVSTSKLRIYKIFSITLVALVFILFLVSAYLVDGYFWRVYNVAFSGFIAFWIIRIVLRLKNVSFDEYSVYYERNGYEVQIPFDEIKDIEIKSLDGIYKINLFQPNQDGKIIYFKTSLWYPLNFKRQDEQVNVLRDRITHYKRNQALQYNEQLPGRRI